LLTAAVIWSVSAARTAGSLISGATFATYLSVLATWLAVHTPSTETGASRQPRTMSRTATGPRQPSWCLAACRLVRASSF